VLAVYLLIRGIGWSQSWDDVVLLQYIQVCALGHTWLKGSL
jgi:hypothetical protein